MGGMVPKSVAKQLRLPKLGQIGYVVKDIDKTVSYYKDTLGIRPWMLLDERPEPCIEKGKGVHPLLRIALAYMGSVQVELIQVVEGESIHLNHPAESQWRVHHLGFMVQDIDKRLEACQKVGIDVLQRGTIRDIGFTVDYAYLDTVEQAGVIIEFIQWRVGALPLPANRLIFNALCGAGSGSFLKGRVVK
jgi:catechol 2,3-dioxygenase-like lactoylglutathione lyase family enzyme